MIIESFVSIFLSPPGVLPTETASVPLQTSLYHKPRGQCSIELERVPKKYTGNLPEATKAVIDQSCIFPDAHYLL